MKKRVLQHRRIRDFPTRNRESAKILQDLCLEARKVLFWHDELGFDYNFNYHRAETDHRKVERFLNQLTNGTIQFKFISHRNLIITVGNHSEDVRAVNEFGTYSDRNLQDNNRNNPYCHVSSILQKLFKKNILTIKNITIMKKSIKAKQNAAANAASSSSESLLRDIASNDTNVKYLREEDIDFIKELVVKSLTDKTSKIFSFLKQNPELLSKFTDAVSHGQIVASIDGTTVHIKANGYELSIKLPIADDATDIESLPIENLTDLIDFAVLRINHNSYRHDEAGINFPSHVKSPKNGKSEKQSSQSTVDSVTTEQVRSSYNANVKGLIDNGVFKSIVNADKTDTWKKQSISGRLASCLARAGADKNTSHRKEYQISLLNEANRKRMKKYYSDCHGDMSVFHAQ